MIVINIFTVFFIPYLTLIFISEQFIANRRREFNILVYHQFYLFLLIKIRVSKAYFQFITWQCAQNKLFQFRCAKRFDEPLCVKIVFSKGFHDFQSLIYTAQKSFQQSYFVQFAINLFYKGLLTS